MKTYATLLLTLLLTMPAATQVPYSDKPVAFVGVNVVPMTTETVLTNQTVLVKDGVIAEIGPADKVKVPRRTQKVEAEGAYIIPGLIDLHAHFFAGRSGNADLLPLYLSQGVTAVLNMRGGRGILNMGAQVNAGELLGPQIIQGTPIQGNVSPTPATYEKGVQAVEQFKREGYDFVKVYNQIPEEGYRGIVDTAKRLDIPLVGHAVRSVGLEGAMANGQHLAHMEEVIYGYFGNDLDESRIPELTVKMKESGISIIATLVAYHTIIRQVDDIDAILQSPGIEYIPENMTKSWQKDTNDYLKRFSKEEADNYLRPAFAFQLKLVKAFHEAGIPILMGTDACIPIVIPGHSAHTELKELVAAGLTPYESLAAATREAAKFIGKGDELGTIEKGKRADFILINENPLVDISRTADLRGVSVRGQWLSNADFDARLQDILAKRNK